MNTIYKYPLTPGGPTRIWIPGYRPISAAKEVRTFALQYGRPCLWVGVDTNAPPIAFVVALVGTGHDIDADVPEYAVYLGAVQLYDGKVVLHAFLYQDPDQSRDPV